MGNGRAPASIDTDMAERVDEGTSARLESPPPGPIGLNAKTDGAKTVRASLADRILAFVRRRRGSRVGDGECFTLIHLALRAAEARSASDYGTVTPNADYVWGTSIALTELQPGDVIQFRDYAYHRVVVTEGQDRTTTDERTEERPHHTAIVQSVDGNGAVTVLEQNSPEGSVVRSTQLYFSSGTTTSGNQTTTIAVRGTLWFYRPEAR